MTDKQYKPGVSRSDRLSDEGLQRLEKQLSMGIKISPLVLAQWINRYGDAAKKIIQKYST